MDILPDKQNLNSTFSNTTYYIDFYQREYKWGTDRSRSSSTTCSTSSTWSTTRSAT